MWKLVQCCFYWDNAMTKQLLFSIFVITDTLLSLTSLSSNLPWTRTCDIFRNLEPFVQFKNVKNAHGGELALLHGCWCFSRFLNCTNGTNWRNASHILFWILTQIRVNVAWPGYYGRNCWYNLPNTRKFSESKCELGEEVRNIYSEILPKFKPC